MKITMHCGGAVVTNVAKGVSVSPGTRIQVYMVPDDMERRRMPKLPDGRPVQCYFCPTKRAAKFKKYKVAPEGKPFEPEYFATAISCVVASVEEDA